MAVAVHLCGRIGKPDAAVAVIVADRTIGIVAQFLVKRDGIALQPHHRLCLAEIRDPCGGMSGDAGCQPLPLDQHDVGPTFLR